MNGVKCEIYTKIAYLSMLKLRPADNKKREVTNELNLVMFTETEIKCKENDIFMFQNENVMNLSKRA